MKAISRELLDLTGEAKDRLRSCRSSTELAIAKDFQGNEDRRNTKVYAKS
jgi:hypothetical protein